MNPKLKGIVAIIVFIVVGMQFVWSFSMTMNRVVPWIRIIRDADRYMPAIFEVEKAYFHKSNLPKYPDTWEVIGKVNNAEPARIVSGGHYYVHTLFSNENDFNQLFPVGRQFDVLVNYNLAYKNDRRIINPRPNLAKETSTILTRCFLISYGNLVITFLIIAIWFNVRGKQRKQQKL